MLWLDTDSFVMACILWLDSDSYVVIYESCILRLKCGDWWFELICCNSWLNSDSYVVIHDLDSYAVICDSTLSHMMWLMTRIYDSDLYVEIHDSDLYAVTLDSTQTHSLRFLSRTRTLWLVTRIWLICGDLWFWLICCDSTLIRMLWLMTLTRM